MRQSQSEDSLGETVGETHGSGPPVKTCARCCVAWWRNLPDLECPSCFDKLHEGDGGPAYLVDLEPDDEDVVLIQKPSPTAAASRQDARPARPSGASRASSHDTRSLPSHGDEAARTPAVLRPGPRREGASAVFPAAARDFRLAEPRGGTGAARLPLAVARWDRLPAVLLPDIDEHSWLSLLAGPCRRWHSQELPVRGGQAWYRPTAEECLRAAYPTHARSRLRLIQKNGGCDHMTCRCGFQFYWSTLLPYRPN